MTLCTGECVCECFHASDRGGVIERGRKLKRGGKRGNNEREGEGEGDPVNGNTSLVDI